MRIKTQLTQRYSKSSIKMEVCIANIHQEAKIEPNNNLSAWHIQLVKDQQWKHSASKHIWKKIKQNKQTKKRNSKYQ